MHGELKTDAARQLMHIQYGPTSTVEDWKASLAEVIRRSAETGMRRVLIDVRTQKDLAGTVDLFKFAADLPRTIAFAVLCELHPEQHRFIETVATNRGAPVKLFFGDEAGALGWLAAWPGKPGGPA